MYPSSFSTRAIPRWKSLRVALTVAAVPIGLLTTGCEQEPPTSPAAQRAESAALAVAGRYPDGRVVFMADSFGVDGERVRGSAVSVMNPDGTDVVRLTLYGSFYGPSWSPDRKRIVLADDVSGMIGVMNANGKNLRWVAKGSYPSWSPDGQRIVFSRSSGFGKGSDLYVMNADGSAVLQLTATAALSETEPAWSADGQRIAFIGLAAGWDVYVMDAVGGPATRVVDCTGKGLYCHSPRWAPQPYSDLAYLARSDTLAQVRILRMSDDETVTLVEEDGPWLSGLAWSPNGSHLMFASRRETPGGPALYSVSLDTRVIERRSFGGAGEHDPSWR